MKIREVREYFQKGVAQVVLLTPFKANEDVDYEALKENVSWLVEKRKYGPMVFTPVGSTGEKYAMTDEEWEKCVKIVVDVANGKVPVIPGASHSGTRCAINRAKAAENIGADGVMIVLPYYHVPEEEGLYLHYKTIADSINIGYQPYNNPDVSKIYMKTHILKKLVDTTDNMVAVKENTPYSWTLYQQIRAIGDKVPVLNGRGEWPFISTAHLGVRGYISGYANFMPEFCLDILKAGLELNFAKLKTLMQKLDFYEDFVTKIQQKYGPTTTILPYPYVSSYLVFGISKAAMDIVGLRGGHMRLPMLDLKQEDKKELEKILFEKLELKKIK